MYLYHGSNVEVISPKIIVSNRNLDFGVGCYTTSNLEQAKRWAYLQTIRRKKGTPIVTYYGFDENDTNAFYILKFDSPNKEWLNFVKTSHARNKIKAYLYKLNKRINIFCAMIQIYKKLLTFK